MNRSSRHEQKHRLRSVLSQDNFKEGTAARTRPFSFDEIMLRRKSKKLSEEAENISLKDSDKTSDHSIPGKGHRNSDDILPVIKHVSEDILKVSSIKEDNTVMSGDKLVNRKDKVNRDPDAIPKATLNKDVSYKTKGGKDDKLARGRIRGDSENESEKRRAIKLEGKYLYADRGRDKSNKESKRKRQPEGNQRTRERNAAKKHDLGKSYEDNERSRERNAVKKHDSGKLYGSKNSERKERKESSEFHYEESRPKNKRSRSRECDKDRVRRSVSLSPRAHKRTSYNVQEQEELSAHSSKDRSRRQQSDDDRNRISNIGLSSCYQRHGGSKNKLGGYSPRKRLTEAAARTPSPPHWSPEKKSAAWDAPPAAADSNFTGSVFSNIPSSNKTVSSNTYQISSVAPVSSKIAKALSGVFSNAAVDSIQLTQATRPMRRLYVENLPASASDKDVMECLNNFLLSSGVNRVQGSQPCISCILQLNKEKGQALVEFLTPEDATASLYFDGRSFSGSILKIRRPKDFIEMAGMEEITLYTTALPDYSSSFLNPIKALIVWQESRTKNGNHIPSNMIPNSPPTMARLLTPPSHHPWPIGAPARPVEGHRAKRKPFEVKSTLIGVESSLVRSVSKQISHSHSPRRRLTIGSAFPTRSGRVSDEIGASFRQASEKEAPIRGSQGDSPPLCKIPATKGITFSFLSHPNSGIMETRNSIPIPLKIPAI
ncbi:hypothetical protein Acr_02g0010290 [Actinidia rufa]|uniref:RRM domain-containing protein n=1 Tax=Actinidia rufa TaxID=165716 RepID=A0A7J0EA35_9ERIC|nr:hypothetical protein Acr_02g0010290 [Actinidia rufa]